MSLKKAGALVLLLSLTGCHSLSKTPTSSEDLAIVGLDENGQSMVRYVARGRHLKKMSGLMSAISENSTRKLDKFEFKEGFKLTRVSVGLQVAFEIGIADIYELEIKPSVDLRFEPLPQPKI